MARVGAGAGVLGWVWCSMMHACGGWECALRWGGVRERDCVGGCVGGCMGGRVLERCSTSPSLPPSRTPPPPCLLLPSGYGGNNPPPPPSPFPLLSSPLLSPPPAAPPASHWSRGYRLMGDWRLSSMCRLARELGHRWGGGGWGGT